MCKMFEIFANNRFMTILLVDIVSSFFKLLVF